MVMHLRQNQPDFVSLGANCLAFRPTREYDAFYDDEPEALHICNGTSGGPVCPARHECLIFALINNEAHGVWGGLQPHDRTYMRRFTDKETWGWHEPTPKPEP